MSINAKRNAAAQLGHGVTVTQISAGLVLSIDITPVFIIMLTAAACFG